VITSEGDCDENGERVRDEVMEDGCLLRCAAGHFNRQKLQRFIEMLPVLKVVG
jgi:hypothetical protein